MNLPKQRPQNDILELFGKERSQKPGFLRVSAPMVRYSKLEFRHLLRRHGVKLCFTPMIIADSFINSEKARQNEFTTTVDDEPIIAQFAAKDANEFINSAQLIYPYVDGIDLNCGCPQSWAIAKGYGCGLLKQPEVVKDIVQTIRRRINENFSVSLKIRLFNHESSKSTIDFARQLEMCGATFLTLHGRTMWQKTSDPLNVVAIKEVKQSLRIPLIANGNVKSWQTACDLYERTQADGIMAARGLLANPTLFNPKYKDDNMTPLDCIQDWIDIAAEAGDNLQFLYFHHHLTFMWGCNLKRKLRLEFNTFTKKQQVLDFFYDNYNIKPSIESLHNTLKYTECTYTHHIPKINQYATARKLNVDWNSNSNGKFFNEFNQKLDENVDEGCDLGSSFFAEI